MKQLKNLSKKQKLIFHLSFLILGGFFGFLYYYFVGCNTGYCSIASNMRNMILWGSAVGLCVSNILI